MGLGRVSGVSAADGARATAEEGFDIPPLVAGAVAGDRLFGPTAGPGVHGRPTSAPARLPREGRGWGATSCVTLRQACRRPNGFGRNLRSKTRWFTGFCNSHQVSHFATFFIDARAEISVVESCCSNQTLPLLASHLACHHLHFRSPHHSRNLPKALSLLSAYYYPNHLSSLPD